MDIEWLKNPIRKVDKGITSKTWKAPLKMWITLKVQIKIPLGDS